MEPRKAAIMQALDRFVAQRPGLEFGNYGDVSAYRSEMRRITRDANDYIILAGAVERSDSVTADMLLKASESAFSGRLTISVKAIGNLPTFATATWTCGCGLYANPISSAFRADAIHIDDCRHKPSFRAEIDYTTGQYFPTEYRKAACAVLASALWENQRASISTPANIEASHQIGSPSIGDRLRTHFRREFGRGIASRWFS